MQMPTSTSGPTPRAMQVVRQLVGARVELGVGELLILEHHRHRFGRARDLLLEELVDAAILG